MHPIPFRLPGALIALLVASTAAPTQTLDRRAVSGGAVAASGGGLTLRATVGETGVVGLSSGSGVVLGQGFWANVFRGIATDTPEGGPVVRSFVDALDGSAPNPFRTHTSISYSVANPSHVSLRIFDVAGRRVSVLEDRVLPSGEFTARWDGRNEQGRSVVSGVYFYRIDIDGWSRTERLVKLK